MHKMEIEIEHKPNLIGVVGQGAFGKFILKALPEACEYRTYDINQSNSDDNSTFDEVLDVDALILAIPLFSYEDFFKQAEDKIKPETLVIDICSVKTSPTEIVKKHLENHQNLLMTHPLFGPQSANDSFEGHTLIVTDSVGEKADKVLNYCEKELGLRIMKMTTEEHDRTMAQVHVLTFFTARGLGEMKLPSVAFQTPSYNEILDLIALDNTHSEDLFRTIQLGNPYAKEIREQYINALTKVHEGLETNE